MKKNVAKKSAIATQNKSFAKKGQIGVKEYADETLDVITEKDPDAKKRKRDRELMEQRQKKELERIREKVEAKKLR